MESNLRCVIDTNVLISAALSDKGPPNQATHTVLRRGVLLASVHTLEELETRLRRPKFERYLQPDGVLPIIGSSYYVRSHASKTKVTR